MYNKLPERPNLEHLKNQAKALLFDWKSGKLSTLERVRPFRFAEGLAPNLARAQLVIAREYGFPSWAKLKEAVESGGLTLDQAAIRLCEIGWVDSMGPFAKQTLLQLIERYPALESFDLACACMLGNSELVATELARDPELARAKIGPLGREALLYACFSAFLQFDEKRKPGIRRVIRILLAHGADPNANYDWNGNALAALYGAAGVANDLESVEMLLEAGAEPNDGESMYHAAEHAGHHVYEKLFAKGVTEASKSHALFRKLDFDDLPTVRWLLENGVDANIRWAPDGSTTLLHALKRGRSFPFFELLLEKGADPNAVDDAGLTPHAMAVRVGRNDVAELLLRHGATGELRTFDRWVQAVLSDRPESEPAPDFGALMESDRDLLCELVGENNLEAIRKLVRAGFPITHGKWATPLHQACWHGKLDAAVLLLELGAPLDVRDRMYNGTPLGWLLHGSRNSRGGPPADYVAILELMVKAGGEVPTDNLEWLLSEAGPSPEIQEWLLTTLL